MSKPTEHNFGGSELPCIDGRVAELFFDHCIAEVNDLDILELRHVELLVSKPEFRLLARTGKYYILGLYGYIYGTLVSYSTYFEI